MGFETPIKQRLRITFGKGGPLKYIGHLDTSQLWERVLRRADLPILYTEGFNTRPRIQLANPLPLGITSECEIIDVMLHTPLIVNQNEAPINLNETVGEGLSPSRSGESTVPAADDNPFASLKSTLQSVSPEGLRILDVIDAPVRDPALQTQVRSAQYCITFTGDPGQDQTDGPSVGTSNPTESRRGGSQTLPHLQAEIAAILAAEEIIKEKKGKRGKIKKVNIRPHIHGLRLDDDGNLIAHLASGDQGNLRPDHLLEQMGLADIHTNIHRFRLHLAENDNNTNT